MYLFKRYTDMRITTLLTCDVVAAYELNKAFIGVITYCGEYEWPKGSPAKHAIYLFGRRLK